MQWLFNLIVFAYIACLNASSPSYNPPPNPKPPVFIADKPDLLPIVLVNNSGLPDNQVHIVLTGKNPTNKTEQIFVQLNASGIGQLVAVNSVEHPKQNSMHYSLTFSDLPTTDSGRVIYIPPIDSCLIWFSLHHPLDMPVSTTKPYGIIQPNFTNPHDSNYNTNFDIFELAFLPTGTNISADATAVTFFSLPLYGYLSTPDSHATTGLYQPRSYIMSKAQELFDTVPEKDLWNKLLLKNDSGILRLVSTGKGMAAYPKLFHSNYLDKSTDEGYSYINEIWTSKNPPSFYRQHPLSLTIPGGSFDTYTGEINEDNSITFTGQKTKTVITFSPPTNTGVMTTSQLIFGGERLTTNTSEDATQLSKLFEEAIISGLLPTTETISNDFLIQNQARFYGIPPNLTSEGKNTGPWYDLYSQALHAHGDIYTYAYDEVLWPQVQISSQNFIPNKTYLGITLGPLTF